MRLTIHHETTYDYPHPAVNSINEAWLRPLTDERQACLSFRLTTHPASDPRPYTDYFGNTVYHFDVQEPHSRLAIVADADVMTLAFDAQAALQSDASQFRPLSSDDSDRWLDFLATTPLTTVGQLVQTITNQAICRDPRRHRLCLLWPNRSITVFITSRAAQTLKPMLNQHCDWVRASARTTRTSS